MGGTGWMVGLTGYKGCDREGAVREVVLRQGLEHAIGL